MSVSEIVDVSKQDSSDKSTTSCCMNPGDTECLRMTLLRKSIRDTTNKCFKSLKKECLRNQSVILDKEAFHRAVHETRSRFEANLKYEMELMYKEENLVNITNRLDRLIEQQGCHNVEKAAWRPSGCVTADTVECRIPVKRRQVEDLREMHERLVQHNRDVMRSLVPLRRKIIDQRVAVDDKCNKIDAAHRVAVEIDTETLASSILL